MEQLLAPRARHTNPPPCFNVASTLAGITARNIATSFERRKGPRSASMYALDAKIFFRSASLMRRASGPMSSSCRMRRLGNAIEPAACSSRWRIRETRGMTVRPAVRLAGKTTSDTSVTYQGSFSQIRSCNSIFKLLAACSPFQLPWHNDRVDSRSFQVSANCRNPRETASPQSSYIARPQQSTSAIGLSPPHTSPFVGGLLPSMPSRPNRRRATSHLWTAGAPEPADASPRMGFCSFRNIAHVLGPSHGNKRDSKGKIPCIAPQRARSSTCSQTTGGQSGRTPVSRANLSVTLHSVECSSRGEGTAALGSFTRIFG